MPEGQADAAGGVGEHAGGAGLVQGRDQVGHAAAEHGGQVGERELDAEQRRRAQHLPGGRGDEAEPVRDGPGQRVGNRVGRELRGARRRDGDAAGPGERGEQLGEVERVARRPGGQPQQAGVRPSAREGADQLGHCRLWERVELNPVARLHRPAQRQQVVALRCGPGHADEQQRHLPCGAREPAPELDGGGVRPLQVVDGEHHGPGGGLVDGQRDKLLGEHRGHVGAAVGGDLAAQQPGDRGPARVRGRAAHAQRVEERQQRQLLAELVARAPELLAAACCPCCAAWAAVASALRTREVLPMPGSPSMSTALPPPRARSLNSPSSSASSLARPASTPAGVTGCMSRSVLAGHLRNKRF